MVDLVTPRQGMAVVIADGGAAVQVFPPGVNGGYVVNPLSDTDQGVAAEVLYIDLTKACDLQGNGTTYAIQPGGSFDIIANSTSGVWVNAQTTGHKFVAVYW